VEALAAVLSNVFFGVLGSTWPRCTDARLLRSVQPASTTPAGGRRGVETPPAPRSSTPAWIIDGRIRGLLDSGLLEAKCIVAQAR